MAATKPKVDTKMFVATLTRPIEYLNSSILSFEDGFDTLPVVSHLYGYKNEKVKPPCEVYVRHNPAWTWEHDEHEYIIEGQNSTSWTSIPNSIRGHNLTVATRHEVTHYRECWTVYLGHHRAVNMNTIAAKVFLRAHRKGSNLVAAPDIAEKIAKDIEWELNR